MRRSVNPAQWTEWEAETELRQGTETELGLKKERTDLA